MDHPPLTSALNEYIESKMKVATALTQVLCLGTVWALKGKFSFYNAGLDIGTIQAKSRSYVYIGANSLINGEDGTPEVGQNVSFTGTRLLDTWIATDVDLLG
ncbi:uncharacterized protein VDAG_01595 [Verticillium dahliae VdLs.17]|uniref:Uncharacterized protein n=2 Tax=Verticillium dahliae TaxID=27337 RepID=G2WSJ9_VERDV|nr:uncharacterized protein VDAG_01595 [Verticillium dahliae VdLs.17]EGY17913.1 hypothetical protein VDAG_01595 [Verticillium dahliae VdLs.17]KAF3342773.1 Putative 3-hydroxymethyl-3-methylglutaryl-CoA lyase 2 [Verticillium dahliae VDG2]KAH6700827.1 hypothetical protein EV126DRAFT_496915 [Verticillium dahliae]